MAGLSPDLDQAEEASGVAPQRTRPAETLLKLFCYPGATATATTHPKESAGLLALPAAISPRCGRWPRSGPASPGLNGPSIGRWSASTGAACSSTRRRWSSVPPALPRTTRSARAELAQLTRWRHHQRRPGRQEDQMALEPAAAPGRRILVDRAEEIDDDGVITRPAEFALTRVRVERLIAYVQNNPMCPGRRGRAPRAADPALRG